MSANGQEVNRPAAEDFEDVGRRLAQALIRAAEEAVGVANENLASAKKFADDLNQEIHARGQEHRNLISRLNAFGNSILEANKRFQEPQVTKDEYQMIERRTPRA